MSKLNLNSKLKGQDLINDIIGNTSQYEIKEISPSKLMPFRNTPGFPFKLHQGKRREELKQSIIEKGITSPIIVRELPEMYKEIRPECDYEIIIGHNRNDIAMELKLPCVPIIVRKDIDSDIKAIDIMNEDNFLQRQEILPSEKARAYKMQMDAIKKQGKRTDMDFCSNGTEVKNSRDEVAKNNDTSAAQIRRYIRLNYLTEKLIDMVDRNILSFRPAVEISYLSQESQRIIESLIENQRIKVSLKQAEKLKELEKDTEVLNLDIILSVLTEKKRERKKLEIPISKVKAYFDDSITDEEMINIILNLLESNIQN
jgi:ParB family chromosome partitioning protein